MLKSGTVTLLIIEDEEAVRCGIEAYFSDSGYSTITADNGLIGVELFRLHQPDIVFTDLRMPVMGGLDVIREIKRISPDTPVFVISGTGILQDAVTAIKLGAWDYVEKPVHDFAMLENMLQKALENSHLRRQIAGLTEKLLSASLRKPEFFKPIITRSPALHSIFQYIEVIAPTGQHVLITGESGVGKELFANALHKASGCKGKLVALNVAGLDDQMFSDTLFGHARGAFTGADRVREGLIAQAAGGTLFLDEIGDLKEASQIKLLRLLQEGEYFPIGSDYPRRSDARILLATHRDLKEMVAKEAFRHDLYYRLFAHQIAIPPLRERVDDIPLLLEHYLHEASHMLGKTKPTPPPELCGYLQAYSFPGNVRELKAMVYDAVTRHSGGVLSMTGFLQTMGMSKSAIQKCIDAEARIVLRTGEDERIPTLEEAEELLIRQAMRLAENRQGVAARYLGINRSALNKKLLKRRAADAESL